MVFESDALTVRKAKQTKVFGSFFKKEQEKALLLERSSKNSCQLSRVRRPLLKSRCEKCRRTMRVLMRRASAMVNFNAQA